MKIIKFFLTTLAFATPLLSLDFDLFEKLQNSQQNILFSPYSLNSALSMTAIGADGETAEQFLALVPQNPAALSLQGSDVALTNANAIWVQETFPLLPSFLADVSQRGTVEALNFKKDAAGAILRINEWAKEHTGGHIEKLVDRQEIFSSTRLVLTNALYFKAPWTRPFAPTLTENAAFHISENRQVEVPMMQQIGSFNVYQKDALTLVELPYGEREELSLFLLAPGEAPIDAKFIQELQSQMKRKKIHLSLPKFSLSAEENLNDVLEELGLTLAFNPFQADFSKMDGQKDLVLSSVLQSCFLKIDESGTEAAAATAAVMNLTAVREEVTKVVFDSPFVFFVQHKETGELLFLGRLTDPQESHGN